MMQTRVAVVTGASRGIGLATARRFAEIDYAVVLAARTESELRSAERELAAQGARVAIVCADASTAPGAAAISDRALRTFGGVDAWVNNAGAAPCVRVEAMTDAQFELALAANVASVFHGTRQAWPLLKQRGGGVIVNISSVASIDPFAGLAVYGACKSWVNLFTRAAADEGRADGIRVFAVAPGAVETRMLRSAFPEFPAEQALAPSEVAGVVVSCCDAAMSSASGSTIFVRR